MLGLGLVNRATARVMGMLWRRFPPIVRIETTNRCNAKCSFCPRPTMKRAAGTMAQDLFERLVAECALGGSRVLHLHNFGEPLLDPDLPDRIAFAKKAGVGRVKIFSNGSLLRGELAERVLDSGIDEIKVSIDGADAEEFARLRKGLDLEKIVANLRDFVKMRDARRNGRPRVVATCTCTDDREATERMLDGVVDGIEYTRLHNWSGALSSTGRKRARKPCSRVWQTFTVLWDGRVSLCCLDYDGDEVIGDLSRGGSIRDVWRNERYEEIRRLHRLSRQEDIALCRDCSKSFY